MLSLLMRAEAFNAMQFSLQTVWHGYIGIAEELGRLPTHLGYSSILGHIVSPSHYLRLRPSLYPQSKTLIRLQHTFPPPVEVRCISASSLQHQT